METLNQKLFDVAYAHFAEVTGRVFVTLGGDVAVHNPIMRPFVKAVSEHFEVLTLNISPQSCQMHSLAEGLYVSARFGGRLAEETFPWEKVRVVFNPDFPMARVLLPEFLIGGQPKDQAEGKPAIEKPAEKKPNPFTVVEGGKNE